MPKPRKTRNNRSQVAANLTGPGSATSGAGPTQMSANNLIINYTAMPMETLRFMLSQRRLNQSGLRRVLITRLQEGDSPAANAAPQVPDQLEALIASIVEDKLANLNASSSPTSRSAITPAIDSAQAPLTQPTLSGSQQPVPVSEPTVSLIPPPARSFNGGQDGEPAVLDFSSLLRKIVRDLRDLSEQSGTILNI